MTQVGVISDTHGMLAPDVYAALAGCDAIIHAGDIGGPDILHELETLAPVYAVLGNNDYNEYGSSVSRWSRPVIDGVRFLVAHYPQDVRINGFGSTALAPGDPIPRICIHGHTHVPELVVGKKASPADIVMCPGSVSRPRSGYARAVGFIGIDTGRVLSARIEDLAGSVIAEWKA